jgi:hypothetical protein
MKLIAHIFLPSGSSRVWVNLSVSTLEHRSNIDGSAVRTFDLNQPPAAPRRRGVRSDNGSS